MIIKLILNLQDRFWHWQRWPHHIKALTVKLRHNKTLIKQNLIYETWNKLQRWNMNNLQNLIFEPSLYNLKKPVKITAGGHRENLRSTIWSIRAFISTRCSRFRHTSKVFSGLQNVTFFSTVRVFWLIGNISLSLSAESKCLDRANRLSDPCTEQTVRIVDHNLWSWCMGCKEENASSDRYLRYTEVDYL